MTATQLPVHVSQALPIPPSAGEVGRRIVRHGLADVLDWIGEPVGPPPDAEGHVVKRADVLLISRPLAGKLRLVRDMSTGVDHLETHDRNLWRPSPDGQLTVEQIDALPDRPGTAGH